MTKLKLFVYLMLGSIICSCDGHLWSSSTQQVLNESLNVSALLHHNKHSHTSCTTPGPTGPTGQPGQKSSVHTSRYSWNLGVDSDFLSFDTPYCDDQGIVYDNDTQTFTFTQEGYYFISVGCAYGDGPESTATLWAGSYDPILIPASSLGIIPTTLILKFNANDELFLMEPMGSDQVTNSLNGFGPATMITIIKLN